MATHAQWTVVFDDKMIIKNHAEGAVEGVGYIIKDNDFWGLAKWNNICLLYTSPSPRDGLLSRMPSSA